MNSSDNFHYPTQEELFQRFIEHCHQPKSGWGTITSSVAACGSTGIAIQNRTLGHVNWQPLFCENWDCPECSRFKAIYHFEHSMKIFSQQPELWYCHFKANPEEMSVIRTRIRQRRAQRGGDYCIIYRADDQSAFLYSTERIEGSSPPQKLISIPAISAIITLTVALRTPGLAAWSVSYSHGWKPKSRKGSGLHKLLGNFPRQKLQEILHQLGTFIGGPLPEGMTTEELARRVIQLMNEQRGEGIGD